MLGNTPEAFGQTWHLPCCDEQPTYKTFVTMASRIFDRSPGYSVIGKWPLIIAGIFQKGAGDQGIATPLRAGQSFDSSKFKHHFPEFSVTTYEEGLELIRKE
ncbi:hypothetical protein RAA17_06025 [Komagataeibacter rhaeticus]|nr:hypothetical protein [Komagataeibacter rhaeticus]